MTNYHVRRYKVRRQRYTAADSMHFIYNSCGFYIIIQEPLYSVCLRNRKLFVTRDQGYCVFIVCIGLPFYTDYYFKR